MAFVEDTSAFLLDFGVNCTAGSVSFLGILDMPDSEFAANIGMVQSRDYKLTYLTSAINLKGGDAISVNNVAYKVRSAPNTTDDGAFTEAMLSKV
jgi:hypothetical protein